MSVFTDNQKKRHRKLTEVLNGLNWIRMEIDRLLFRPDPYLNGLSMKKTATIGESHLYAGN